MSIVVVEGFAAHMAIVESPFQWRANGWEGWEHHWIDSRWSPKYIVQPIIWSADRHSLTCVTYVVAIWIVNESQSIVGDFIHKLNPQGRACLDIFEWQGCCSGPLMRTTTWRLKAKIMERIWALYLWSVCCSPVSLKYEFGRNNLPVCRKEINHLRTGSVYIQQNIYKWCYAVHLWKFFDKDNSGK